MKSKLSRLKSPINRFLFSAFLSILILIPARRPHWVGNRSPRTIYLASYLFIVWVVVATAILIAAQNIQLGIIMFGLFVVPLYAVTRYASGYSKRAHWVTSQQK